MSILDREFVIVGGKGGVGRTIVSFALGVAAAKRGRKTLVCLANAPPRFKDILGDVQVGTTIPVEVKSGLFVVNLEPRASQEEYGLNVISNRILHRIIFSNRVVRSFLDAVPGLAEWAMLGKASYHALAQIDGKPEYDLVIFDSPATGHGLEILALPRAIASSVPAGRIRGEAIERVLLMGDPDRCEILPVALPEEMPVSETQEYVQGLEKLGLEVNHVVVNMVEPSGVSPRLESMIEEHRGDWPDWLLPAASVHGRYKAQKIQLSRLAEIVVKPQIILPRLETSQISPVGLEMLADCLLNELGLDSELDLERRLESE